MIRYKENPSLKLRTVRTLNGETEYRRNCRKIKDKYYVIGVDCVEVNGKWHSITSKLVCYDYAQKKYVIQKTTPLTYGAAFFTNKKPQLGYFTEDLYNNVVFKMPGFGAVRALNEDLLLKNNCIEDISSGTWCLKDGLSSSTLTEMSRIRSRKVFKEKGYNLEDNTEEYAKKVEAFDKYPLKISKMARLYAKIFGNASFGIEIETSMGYLPDHLQYRTGIVICRDGSIDNAEYVTIPFRGAKGLANIGPMCQYLTERTNIDIKCSLHIHLGTISEDRMSIVALYALSIAIQDELFTMFPYYKTEWKGYKKQSYADKLRKLGIGKLNTSMTKEQFKQSVDESYYRIFKWLNNDQEPDDDFNRRTHRHQQTAKWERKRRYFWMNLMNMFFSTRKTAEFRIHQATTNKYKITNWLFICNAIVLYAEKYSKQILTGEKNITLDEVIDVYYDMHKNTSAKFLCDYLKAYVQDRKDYFARDKAKGDVESRQELVEDKNYVFSYKGVSDLF